MIALEAQVHVAAFCDQQRVGEGFRHLGEESLHLGGGTQIIGIIRHAHAVGIVERGVGLDGEQDILQARVVLLHVMHVVGGDIVRRIARAQLEQFFIQVGDLFDVVLLQFHKETVAAEHVIIPVQAAHCFLGLGFEQGARDLCRHAAGGADQSLGMRGQEIVIDAREIIEAFQLGSRGDLEQVAIPRLIFSQQQQVGRGAVEFGILVLHPPRRHVCLHPDDRLDARAQRRIVKIDHPEHRAVIGDRDGRHLEIFDALHQLPDIREAVEQ